MTFQATVATSRGLSTIRLNSANSLGPIEPPFHVAPTILSSVFLWCSTVQPGVSLKKYTVTSGGNSASIRMVGLSFSFGIQIVYFSKAPTIDSFGQIVACPSADWITNRPRRPVKTVISCRINGSVELRSLRRAGEPKRVNALYHENVRLASRN